MNRDPDIIKENRERRRRQYYIRHRECLLEKARARYERLKTSPGSPEEIEARKRRHREAQARYRADNKTKIQLDNLFYRARQKKQKEQERLLEQPAPEQDAS